MDLHDACIEEIKRSGDDVAVKLHAFVHDDRTSPSCAGEWQPVELRLRDATVEHSERGDGWSLEGNVRVDADCFDNMLPLPFRRGGAVTLVLRGVGLSVTIHARSVWLVTEGAASADFRRGTALALLLGMRPLISFTLVASFCACGSSADPDRASETSGATSCATNASLAGASYDVSKSRFAFGSKPTLESTGGLSRWVGSDGVVAIDADGSELGIMNANAPETNLPDWSSNTAQLTQHARDYWVSMGVLPCQIGIVGVDSSAGGGGSVNGPTMVVAGPSSVTLARAIAGVPVVESLAVARFNSSDQTTEESFYWPDIPADVVSAAIAFKNQLAAPGALAAYMAKLPADAQGAGRVVIHHTSGVTMGPFQSAATYDVVQTTPENDGGDLNFDPAGTPITTVW